MMLDPATDPILDWYRQLYGDVDEGWLSFFSIDRRTGQNKTEWCRVTDLEGAAEITRRLNMHGDVWHGVAIRTHRTSGRGGADECGWITALWADIDFKDPGHQGNDRLPPDEATATEIVRQFPIRPTALTHTGGGLQAWYLLDEPVPTDELGDLLEAFGATWDKVGRDLGYHVDNVFDLARIMRPAGSFNRKLAEARPVTLTGAKWERRYGISEIRDACIDPPQPTVPRKRNDVPYIGPDRPGDEFAARHDGHELLTDEGFHAPDVDRNGDTHYRAPHRGAKDQSGATVYADGHVTVWSETFCANRPGLKAHHGYDLFGFYVALRHAGDFAAATKALREAGYGASKQADPFGRDREPLGSAPRPANPQTGELDDQGDDEPEPLDRFDLPKFPIDVLPKWMREEVAACAEAIQVPVEIPAALALTAISTAIAGKIDVDGINYRKPTNIYLCVVAPSGVGKSPVAARMLGPLQELEREMLERAQDGLAEAKTEAKVIEEKANAAAQLLKKDPTSDLARRAMKDAELEGAMHEVPAAPRLIIDDHTPEALVKVIAEQTTHRIAVLSPEGASLFTSMTGQRYKDASAPPEVPAVYLSAWDGEPITVDRVNRAPQAITRPILTVGVLVQPVIVDRLAATPMVAQQGALARFLWVVARDNVGRRDPTRRRHAAPPSPEYADKLKALARRCLQWQHPTVYLATEEAADHFDAVDIARERRMGLGGDLDTYRPVIAKLNGYQWRLAAILAAAHDDPTSEGLTLERARQADRLADYFLAHSIAVHRRAGLDERGSVLRTVAAYLVNHAGEQIDWRDFQLHMRGVVDQMADLGPTLEELVRMRWITVEEGSLDAIGNRGLPNPTVAVDARLRATSDGAYS